MTDYTSIVNDLLGINDTLFAIGTSNKSIDKISIRMAFDKNWHNIAEQAAAAIEELQAEVDFYKKRLKEWCGVCPDADCSNCEILGHGHWIPQVTEDGGHNDLLDCSLCGESIWNTQKNKKFCPNCGAKMEETEDEVHSDI